MELRDPIFGELHLPMPVEECTYRAHLELEICVEEATTPAEIR